MIPWRLNTFIADGSRHWDARRPYQMMLLVFAVLAVYYPGNFAELCTIDDVGMVAAFRDLTSWSLKDIFVPGVQGGWYYRPVIWLSFILDKYLWNLAPGLMHLENMVLHTLNTVLVFWLAEQLLAQSRQEKSFIPFMAALVFGLHPITSESVNWLSGRSDILAGTFILVCANFLLRFNQARSFPYVLASIVSLFLGFLTKETALAFLPGALLILWARDQREQEVVPSSDTLWKAVMKKNWLFPLFGLGAVAIFFLLRSLAFLSNEFRLGQTVQFMLSEPLHSTFVFFRAFGFYLKKLMFPFPLNFAIVEADPLYELLGIALAVLCLVIASRRTLPAALFIAGVLLITPAFPIALGKIAWVPYAERYLYIPSAFIIVAAISSADVLVRKIPNPLLQKGAIAASGLMLAVLAVGTFQRSKVWMNNETLLRDTVEKSPSFYPTRIDYAFVLANRCDLDEARTQFAVAKTHSQASMLSILSQVFQKELGSWEIADFGLAYVLEREGKTAEAAAAYEAVFASSKGRSASALERIVSLYGDMLQHAQRPGEIRKIHQKLEFYAEKMYNLNGNPLIFYKLGKIMLLRGDRGRALDYFRMAYDTFEAGDEYKPFAKKNIERLEKHFL